MRTCERLLGTPGKTPDALPQPRTKPFAGFVRGSVELAERLVEAGWNPIRNPDDLAPTMLEAYPGATWRKLVAQPLPHKATRAGIAAREALLRGLGLVFSRAPASHDELDAALCAWLGWQLRRVQAAVVVTVGTPCFDRSGRLREGVILDVAAGCAQVSLRSHDDPNRAAAAPPPTHSKSPGARARSETASAILPDGLEADWIYFASPSKANRWETAELALTEEVLWRTAYNSAGRLCANVGNVRVGDLVLLAYSAGSARCDAIGTFRVMPPADPVTGASALNRISDPVLADRLTGSQYPVDPVVGAHTGFLVETVWAPAQSETPQVTRPVGNNAIWRASPAWAKHR